MASVEFRKGSEEWEMFQEYWKLCQEVWKPEDSDTYWEETIDMVDAFYKKYNTEFAKALSLVLINELERKYKEMR